MDIHCVSNQYNRLENLLNTISKFHIPQLINILFNIDHENGATRIKFYKDNEKSYFRTYCQTFFVF